ncbi:MAG: GAF domain-containing protein [Xanthomonadales bacterium]|nr:GAF domain-containing protein [Xanthomonadales bacterium]
MDRAEKITLHEITERVIANGFDPAVAQWVIDSLENRHGYEFGAILGLDPTERRLRPIGLSRQGRDQEFLDNDFRYVATAAPRAGSGITGWVAVAGRTALCPDVNRDTRYFKLRSRIHSELCVPIKNGFRVLGVINTESTRKNAYRSQDAEMLEKVASLIGMARPRLSGETAWLSRDSATPGR